jgi:hypothetical protein
MTATGQNIGDLNPNKQRLLAKPTVPEPASTHVFGMCDVSNPTAATNTAATDLTFTTAVVRPVRVAGPVSMCWRRHRHR